MIKNSCSRCGYSNHKGSLLKHHKDGNHYNNDTSNIEVLCFNCHIELHHNSEIKIKRKPRDTNYKTKNQLYKKIENKQKKK